MYGCYFFLSSSSQEHYRDVFTIVKLFAQFGGFFSTVSQIMLVIAVLTNQYLFWGKLIRHMFIFK
jgi:hypothetical protein